MPKVFHMLRRPDPAHALLLDRSHTVSLLGMCLLLIQFCTLPMTHTSSIVSGMLVFSSIVSYFSFFSNLTSITFSIQSLELFRTICLFFLLCIQILLFQHRFSSLFTVTVPQLVSSPELHFSIFLVFSCSKTAHSYIFSIK